jgi:hypothetical protein
VIDRPFGPLGAGHAPAWSGHGFYKPFHCRINISISTGSLYFVLSSAEFASTWEHLYHVESGGIPNNCDSQCLVGFQEESRSGPMANAPTPGVLDSRSVPLLPRAGDHVIESIHDSAVS